jgi:ABC-type antimicrobial peptide transport system permease subunit
MEADIDALRKGGREIIGVVEDVRDSGPDKSPWPEAYFSYEQNPVPSMSILLRSKSANLAFEIRREVMQLDPDLPVYNIMRMEDLVNSAANERRFQVVTVCVFAAIALLLAISGLYSTVSYSVIQRKQEIGIRMALGARPATVMRKVLSDGMVLGAIGVLFGVAGSFLVARFVNSLLYGVRLNDLNTIVSVTALILGVVFAASYLPSRQAAKVEPAVVLRADR